MTQTDSTPPGATVPEAAIRVDGLSKVYPRPTAGALLRNFARSVLGRTLVGTRALEAVSFSVAPGEAVGIVGRNGSGKSTLLQILAGALRPTTGDVSIEGRLGTLLDLTAGINPEYTGAENAVVLGMLAGLSRSEVRARLDAIREFSGLGDAFDRPVKSYSSGMTMRLGFSAAIHGDPEVLLIDEALAVGDAFYQQRCLRKMRALRDAGVTIVLVSHDPSAVISLCDRALWLENGRVLEAGEPKNVLRLYLAARYRDDCDLEGSLVAAANGGGARLDTTGATPLEPAGAIERMDERFGNGRARIEGFEMRDRGGRRLTTCQSGEPVAVVLSIRAEADLDRVLLGFTLRNRLGDVVTATNNELEGVGLPSLAAGSRLDVSFDFAWPALVSGPVTLSPAVAEGSIASHEMCDWVENALVIESENPRGLFGWMSLDDVEVAVGSPRDTDRSATSPVAIADAPVSVADDRSNEHATESSPDGTRPAAGSDRIEFAIDEPRRQEIDPGQVTEQHELLFSGWSFAVSGDPVEVTIRVEGAKERVVVPMGFREDVGRVHADAPHASRSGFAALVALPRRAGRASCEVEVRTPRLSRTVAEFELDLPPVVPAVELAAEAGVRTRPLRRIAGDSRDAPRRVLFVSHTFNLEGAPRSLFEMARGLPRDAFEPRVVSPVDGPIGGAWREAGLATRILPVEVRVGGRDDFDALIRRLAALLSVERPELLVANTLDTFWAIHVAAELGVPAIWIVRESEDPYAYFHSRLPTRIAERGVEALALAERVVFVAEATRALFRSALDVARTIVIPNGLDVAGLEAIPETRIAAIRSKLGIRDDGALLLCVGTPCLRKGQLELIEALVSLRDCGLDVHALFLGMIENDYSDRMRERVEQTRLGDRVDFLPPTSDPLDYFAAADVLVCPSFQESLPRVVLEAMAFAKPIVASDVFGVPELVRDGLEARLVEAGDRVQLSAAIEELVTSPDRAAELGRCARARVEAEFGLDRCVGRYAELFRAVLEAPVVEGAD